MKNPGQISVEINMFRFMPYLDAFQMGRQGRPPRMGATRGTTGWNGISCSLPGRQFGFHCRQILIQVFLEQGLLLARERLTRRPEADSTQIRQLESPFLVLDLQKLDLLIAKMHFLLALFELLHADGKLLLKRLNVRQHLGHRGGIRVLAEGVGDRMHGGIMPCPGSEIKLIALYLQWLTYLMRLAAKPLRQGFTLASDPA